MSRGFVNTGHAKVRSGVTPARDGYERPVSDDALQKSLLSAWGSDSGPHILRRYA